MFPENLESDSGGLGKAGLARFAQGVIFLSTFYAILSPFWSLLRPFWVDFSHFYAVFGRFFLGGCANRAKSVQRSVFRCQRGKC